MNKVPEAKTAAPLAALRKELQELNERARMIASHLPRLRGPLRKQAIDALSILHSDLIPEASPPQYASKTSQEWKAEANFLKDAAKKWLRAGRTDLAHKCETDAAKALQCASMADKNSS